MTDFGGWHMPVRYTGDKKEHHAVREAVGLFDVSHMGEVLVNGPKALEFLQYVTCNNVSKLAIGQAHYNVLTTPQGGAWDDILIYRRDEQKFLLVINAANQETDFEWLQAENQRFGADLVHASELYVQLALQGPKALSLLEKLGASTVGQLGYYRFVEESLLAVPMLISRTGYTGSEGFELYFPPQFAEFVWQRLLDAGASLGIEPCGLSARDSLRLEAGMHLYGNELDEQTSLYEANLGWVVKLDKGDFIGKPALVASKENLTKKLVGFRMTEFGIPRSGYAILHEGQPIGNVTSGILSPTLNIPLGLAYVAPAFANIGQTFQVQVRKKTLHAEVVPTPFYKIQRSA
jgi:aminomethyltransferase